MMTRYRAGWVRGRSFFRSASRPFAWLVAWAIIQTPHVAAACSVCSAGRDEENQTAFLLSTLFMSLLPLIAIGSIVYAIWWRIQKVEAERATREAASVAIPVSRGLPVSDS